MHVHTGHSDGVPGAVAIRFALPTAKLLPFVTTYYYTEVVTSASEPVLQDYLHPEWPNLRFAEAGWARGALGDSPLASLPAFNVTGPTSVAARFQVSSGRSWGIGLMPLGWSTFFDVPASDYADRVTDGNQDEAFAVFRPLSAALANSSGDFAEELAIIESHMDALVLKQCPNGPVIERINAELIDPELATVAELADRVAMNIRSLERLSKRAFGFTPKLLLRRQRFLRSLAQFMLDPSLNWLRALDYQYHDQAHFVRDFKRFMGMSPSAYAKLHKPLLVAAARARMAIAGEAVQGLHDPVRSQP